MATPTVSYGQYIMWTYLIECHPHYNVVLDYGPVYLEWKNVYMQSFQAYAAIWTFGGHFMPHMLPQHQLHKVHLTTTWHYIVLVKCKFIIISTQPTSHTLSSLMRHERYTSDCGGESSDWDIPAMDVSAWSLDPSPVTEDLLLTVWQEVSSPEVKRH